MAGKSIPIPVESPVAHAKSEVAAKANAWIDANPSIPVLVVFHTPVTAIDPATEEVFIEARADIVAKVSPPEGDHPPGDPPPIGRMPLLERFYSTLGVVTRKVLTPEEATRG